MTRTPTPPRTRTASARRFSPALALGTAALLLGGGYVGATAIFSSRAQDTTQQAVQQLTSTLGSSGVVEVEKSEYHKGFTDSTQTMTLIVQDTPDGNGQPLRLLVTNHIKHGPLLGAAGVGQALVDTDIRFADPKTQAALDKAFGGQKPVIRTVVGLTGASDTAVRIPAGKFTEEGQPGDLSWQPLTGAVRVAGLKTNVAFSWPGLFLNAPGTSGAVGPMKLSGTTTRANKDDLLGSGQMNLTLDRLTVSQGTQPVTFSGLKVSSDSRRDGNFQNLAVRYAVADVSAAGRNLKNLELALSFDHLAREPLQRLARFAQDLQATQASSKSPADLTPAQEKQLETDVLALLRGQPVLRLSRLSLGQPGRDVQVSGQATLPGASRLTAENWNTLAPAELMSMVSADFKLSTSEAGLRDLAATLGQGQAADVQTLVDSGTLKREGNKLVATFSFKDGQMLMNGQPVQ
ncbi:YdgA family protein [Deinococcus radiodurans]|jgi:Uncharacterized protein conserved in bacteria|uniref:YdgA family protein n=2 Tax=Deinococcus radiodurans TaxID=1299 RepID=UPI0004807282|nr:YdgA family protein [Deinococcus radiodurans]ANC70743.1 hypothetical protein A2G07_02605 [Deinococcus radiodurans R1 = ATCC 13939 = DSM 20539]QEM71584.1 DUF945 domain-containing protein [Deinococcus radiodurans]QIP27895.1 YdgA family protein [Deinococcus radiodurans]QIP31225.1 YdgA family protein [Deinococcus radiodurans]UDL01226.1 DUF945 domain-containing protein [Deinococcus radiodurans R1 = ATCC 13939 = DSM 20539]